MDSAAFYQTVRNGGKETAASLFRHCRHRFTPRPVQSLAIARATSNLCECVCGLPVCLPEAILLTASKWQRALDLHLTAAGRKSIRPGIDLIPIRSLMDGKRQLWLSGLSGITNPYRVDWKGRCIYAANLVETAVKFLNKQSDGRITLDLQNIFVQPRQICWLCYIRLW